MKGQAFPESMGQPVPESAWGQWARRAKLNGLLFFFFSVCLAVTHMSQEGLQSCDKLGASSVDAPSVDVWPMMDSMQGLSHLGVTSTHT